jgi:methyl-accepting chemotaxis protein
MRRRRKRLTPELQVLVAIGCLVASLAGAVGISVYLIVGLEDDTADLSHRHVQYATAIHDAALSAKGIANDERGFLLRGNPEFLDELEDRTIAARAAFAAADAYASTAQEHRAARVARADFERWMRLLQAGLAAYQAGSRERAIAASLGTTRQLRKRSEASLAEAHAIGLRSIELATSSVSRSASRSVMIMLVYLAVALAVGIAVAIWVVRTVLKPAYVLSQNAFNVLMQARVLVEEDEQGSHHAVGVEVPMEAVNALGDSVLDAQDALGTAPQQASP